MNDIDPILAQLENKACDLDAIRVTIADLIDHYLQLNQASNNIAALTHLTNAVGSLNLNINAAPQPTTKGLEACLSDLKKAIVATSGKVKQYQLRGKRAETITYGMLMESVQALRNKIPPQHLHNEKAA